MDGYYVIIRVRGRKIYVISCNENLENSIHSYHSAINILCTMYLRMKWRAFHPVHNFTLKYGSINRKSWRKAIISAWVIYLCVRYKNGGHTPHTYTPNGYTSCPYMCIYIYMYRDRKSVRGRVDDKIFSVISSVSSN